MAKITVKKKTNYTTIDNNILKNKNLSLKARGLLVTMLSLPDEWDYTVNGLCSILKDGKSSIQSALKELEENGYLVRVQTKDENGRFSSTDYTLYEIPLAEKPLTENPSTDNLSTENQPQLNTNKLNKNKEITNKENTNNINASNSNELEDTINASVPDRTERIPFLNMTNCTQDEIKNHYAIRCMRIAKNRNIADPQKIDDMSSIIAHFCKRYYEVFGENHPVLSDRALERVFINFCFPPELLYKYDITSYEDYKELIDRYFMTEYGKYQLSGVVPDYSISHFMSEEVLTNLCKNAFKIPHA